MVYRDCIRGKQSQKNGIYLLLPENSTLLSSSHPIAPVSLCCCWLASSNIDMTVSTALKPTRFRTMFRSREAIEMLRRDLLQFVPWIGALYFVIKTLQTTAAQGYASLSQDGIPDRIVGFVSNASTSDNLKAYGDMMNFPAASFMGIFAGLIVGLTIIVHVVFGVILQYSRV